MNAKAILLILALAAIGVGGTAYYNWRTLEEAPPDGSAKTESPQTVAEPQPPKVRYPIAENVDEASNGSVEKLAMTESTKQTPTPAVEPLPLLDDSDPKVAEELGPVIGLGSLRRLFNIDNFVRRVVVTVDNLPRRQVPPRYIPTAPVEGRFQAQGDEGRQHLSEKNFKRYSAYVDLLESIDTDALVAAYVFLYPLFQEAYEDLGYPDAYFNDRVVEAIDNLLAAPEPEEPVKLVRPSVMFKYADPGLERLSAGQKILIRMGAGNARRVKMKLREVRRRITGGERVVQQTEAGNPTGDR